MESKAGSWGCNQLLCNDYFKDSSLLQIEFGLPKLTTVAVKLTHILMTQYWPDTLLLQRHLGFFPI